MTITGVTTTPLSIIDTKGGAVLHAIKRSDYGFSGFGEAYFSTIEHNAIKGWKRHKEMVLNLIVPIGSVRFILYDDRKNQINKFQEVVLSLKGGYNRLTVPPMIWVGFQGLDIHPSIVLNIASIEHSSEEIDQKELDEIKFNWSKS
jgi:dTDP-4-dehydrorhamnose 3,5-epimerase